MSLRLIIEDDEGSTTIVPLGADAITIGRQQGNTIQLTEKNVSRRHARLYPESDTWVIEDLGSYNGVKVNGKSVDARIVLKEGDVVQIGDYHLALTEDADRRGFNYDRPRSEAANDLEPMMVSSSTSLPRLTPEELRAMSSGPQPVTPPPQPMFVDSGPVPATHGYPREPKRGSAGLVIAVGVAVIGALALGGVWMTMQGDDPPAAPAKATKNEAKPPPTKEEPAKVEEKEIAPQPTTAAGPATGPVPVADDDAGVQIEPDEGGDELPPDAKIPPEPKPKPEQPKPEPKQPKPEQPKPEPKPEQPKPEPKPEPEVDVDALIADAKKVQFSDPAKAYSLYSQAYAAKKRADIAEKMVMAACRIPDAGKAKSAFGKVKDAEKRQELADVCGSKGVTLTP